MDRLSPYHTWTSGEDSKGPTPPRRPSTMAKLADEIEHEFLTCKICLDSYKSPKCLNCLHTFCEQCIENHIMSESTYKKYSDYREFTCPMCRKRTQLPIGGVKKLPDNFLVSSLSEVIGRERPSKFPFCDFCKSGAHKHREAVSKCLDCNKLLCKGCVEMHKGTKVTKTHSIFDVEIEKDIECKEHSEEVVRFYCEPCDACICVLCTFNEHKDHDIYSFTDAVVKYKENIENLLRSCQTKISDYEVQLTALAECETLIKETEDKIKEMASDFVSQVKGREKILLEEVRNIYGPEIMTLVENRQEMQANLDGLKSTCNLTELILKGKDIELLLLKKQVSDKLSSLTEQKFSNLPSTVSKKIRYVPGTLDMGYVQDMDRPLLTRFRSTRPSLPSLSGHELIQVDDSPILEHRAMQTDSLGDTAKTFAEIGIQTEPPPKCSDAGIGTENIETDEKAVSTKGRLGSASEKRRSETNAADSSEPQSPGSQRRTRRRRERAKTSDYSSLIEDSTNTTNAQDASEEGRKPRRSRFLYGGSTYRSSPSPERTTGRSKYY